MDFTDLDKAHEMAAALTEESSIEDLNEVLSEFKAKCWPTGVNSKGTIAWIMADFLPRWLIELQKDLNSVTERLNNIEER